MSTATSEDFIQASPGTQKRRRRHRLRWTRPRKKCKLSQDETNLDVTENTEAFNSVNELSTIHEEIGNTTNPEPPSFLQTALYGDQESENEMEQGDLDLFTNEKLLEKVAGSVQYPIRHLKEDHLTQEFVPASELPAEDYDSAPEQHNVPMVSQSFITESQILQVCEAADLIDDIRKEEIMFSQWDSPLKRITINEDIPPSKKSQSIAQEIIDDFNELCSSQGTTSVVHKPVAAAVSPEFKFKTKVLRTYSRLRAEKSKTTKTARNLIDQYDSDSKSSLSSDLSVQENDMLDYSPADDRVELNKSSRICENLMNLSSYFSQSFTQEDTDSTIDGVYNHIMLIKSKRMESRLLDWYWSGKNFTVNESLSSSDFEGFPDSEIESVCSDLSHKSENIQTFLDDDEEVFHEVSTSFLAGASVKRYSDQDIENVLESADKVLAEITQHLEGKEGTSEYKERDDIIFKKEHNEAAKPIKTLEKTQIADIAKNKLIFANENKHLSSYLDSKSKFVDFKSASGRAIKVSEESKRKANNILMEVETWTDDDLLKEFSSVGERNVLKEKVLNELNSNQNRTDFKEFDFQQFTSYNNNNRTSLSNSQKTKLSLTKKDNISTEKESVRNKDGVKTEFQKRVFGFGGFQSASGKPVCISNDALFKAQRLFSEVENDVNGLHNFVTHSDKDLSNPVADLPEECFNKQTDKKSVSKIKMNDSLAFSNVSALAGGFKCASGKDIKISADALKKAQTLFNNIDGFDDVNEVPNVLLEGFTKSSHTNLGQADNLDKCEHRGIQIGEPFKKPSTSFQGFQSAAGKKLSISKDSLFKAQKLFNEVDNDKFAINELIETSEKTIKENANKLSNKSDQRLGVLPSNIADYNSASLSFADGFKSASGKGIKISEEAMMKAQILFNNIDGFEEMNEVPDMFLKGFTKPSHTNTNLETFQNHRQAVNIDQSKHLDYQTEKPFKKPSTSFLGFQSAAGNELSISKESLIKAQKLFNEVDSDKNALNELLEISEKNIKENANKLNKECDQRLEVPPLNIGDCNNAIPSFSGGFKSASGKDIKISEEALEKAYNLYNKEGDFEGLEEVADKVFEDLVIPYTKKICRNNINDENIENADGRNKLQSLTLAMRTGTKVEDSSNTDVNKFRPLLNQSKVNGVLNECNTPLKPNNFINKSEKCCLRRNNTTPLQVATKSSLNLHRTCFKSSSKSKQETFVTPVKTNLLEMQIDTPDLKEFFDSVRTSTPQTVKRRNNLSLTQEISASTAALLEDELKSSVTDDFKKICWDDIEDSFKENKNSPGKSEQRQFCNRREHTQKNKTISQSLTEPLRIARQVKRQKQSECIKDKLSASSVILPGYLYLQKRRLGRPNWKDIVAGQEATSYTLRELKKFGLNEDIANIHFSNADIFEFDGRRFYSEIRNVDGIELTDGVQLIPDDDNKISLHEIKQAFLAMNGVYPTLIPKNWVRHHYKMILLKYSWLEKSFPAILANQLCTPENIILQLKYRYDREIDRTERSVLKKILECDDIPAKRMVLFVIDINQNNLEIELVLTDWWYTIKTSIDLAMHNLIRLGKVCIGTKLMIQNAELLNCENGCSPLEVPPQARLKIHTNSTRRAKWDVKLGLYKIPFPFSIRLDSVRENGGLVSRLSLCVLRVYPSVFLNKAGTQGVHSEKVEVRLQSHEEKMDFENFEMIFSQIQRETMEEEKMRRRRIGALQKYVRDLDDPEDLLELIQEGYNLDEFDLSPEQEAFLAEYQQEISSKMQEMQQKVQERLQNHIKKRRTSTEILKIRVIDSTNPVKSAVLSIWRPQEGVKNMFHEGVCFELNNCTPSSIRYGDMQLNSTKNSEYKFSSIKIATPKIMNLLRKITTISEINSRNFHPNFNEVDTCGLVVMISAPEQKKFQSVFICDLEENILCINFWSGIKEYAYDDVIQIERFITASNLQWRSNSGTGLIPCAFVTELSTFSENPKSKYFIEALNSFKEKFRDTNLTEFSMKCSEKIKNLQANGRTSGNAFATPVRKCLSSSTTPSPLSTTLERPSPCVSLSDKRPQIPSPQIRIDRLRMYGVPPAISPLAFNKCKRSARKGFRIPRKLTEDIKTESR